jgi:hypothetical protein
VAAGSLSGHMVMQRLAVSAGRVPQVTRRLRGTRRQSK